MKRSPLRRRSKQRAKLYREVRSPLVAEILAERPWCERCPTIMYPDRQFSGSFEYMQRLNTNRSTVVHEKLTRARGGSITDKANCVALCGDCHDEIHLNPRQATEDGWLISGKKPIPAFREVE